MPKIIDYSKLKTLYNQNLIDKEIAKILGCSQRSVCIYRNNHSLKTKHRLGRKRTIDNNEVLRLYRLGLSDKGIATKLCCTYTAVRYHRKRLGLPTIHPRRTASQNTLKRFKELWLSGAKLKTISKELGYQISTLSQWRKKLNLPKRHWNGLAEYHMKRRKMKTRLETRCLRLRRSGMNDDEIYQHILEKTGEHIEVPVYIGRAIMRLCRLDESCPYKALLPENFVEVKK